MLEASDEESYFTTGGSDFGSPNTPSARINRHSSNTTPSSCNSLNKSVNDDKTPTLEKASKPKVSSLHQKTVQRTLCFEESTNKDDLIYQRTRSKISLSDTPLDQLEMAFKPPDISEDMYETECDNTDWKKFLIDYVNPTGNFISFFYKI